MAYKKKSDIRKEIYALADLAISVKEESVFQQEPLYMKFKASSLIFIVHFAKKVDFGFPTLVLI